MRARAALVAVLATVLLLPAAALADTDDNENAQQDLDLAVDVDASAHPTVEATVTAPRPLVGTDIPADAFRLDEGGEPRDITVSKEASDDLEVVLIVDTSTSMEIEPMEAVKDAALSFIDRLQPGTQVAVVEFNTEPVLLNPLSDDLDEARATVSGLTSTGFTALYDAVAAGLEVFDDDGDDAQRTMVLIADGEDNNSTTTLDEAVELLEDSGVPMHVAELNTDRLDVEALEALAGATDGALVSTEDPEELTEIYQGIADQLIDQYTLAYESEASGATEVRVSVEHDGVRAETVVDVALPAAPPEPEPEPEEEPEAEIAPPAPGSIQSLGWFATTEALVVGVAAVAIALLLLLLVILTPSQGPSQLRGARRAEGGGGRSIPGLTELAERTTALAERVLKRRGYTSGLDRALERAGINLRAGEFVVLCASAAVTALAVGWLIGGLLLGLVLAAVTVFACRMWVGFRGDRRQAAFADQLGDTLQLLAGTLRAGYGLMQAIDSVAKESDSPTAEEYRRLVVEVRLGRDVTDALDAMRWRIGNEDFEWVVQAIGIHREVGGDLAEVLDTVAGTIRERNQIRRQVKALSAEGRLSGAILFGLPFVVGGFLVLTNPTYLGELLVDPIGWGMLAMGAVLLAIGGLWIKKTIKLRF